MMLLVSVIFVLALCSFGDSSPVQLEEENYNSTNLLLSYNRNTDEGPTLLTNVTDVERLSFNGNSTLAQSRRRRSLSLTNMIHCGAPQYCDREYLSWYGNYCGVGGSGTPIDEIDRCCQAHDACYDDLHYSSKLRRYFATYSWGCRDGVPRCYDHLYYSEPSDQSICHCDKVFVDCLNTKAGLNRRC